MREVDQLNIVHRSPYTIHTMEGNLYCVYCEYHLTNDIHSSDLNAFLLFFFAGINIAINCMANDDANY